MACAHGRVSTIIVEALKAADCRLEDARKSKCVHILVHIYAISDKCLRCLCLPRSCFGLQFLEHVRESVPGTLAAVSAPQSQASQPASPPEWIKSLIDQQQALTSLVLKAQEQQSKEERTRRSTARVIMPHHRPALAGTYCTRRASMTLTPAVVVNSHCL